MNKSNLMKNFIAFAITLSMLGGFAVPAKASAIDFGSILGSIGINYGSNSGYVSGSYYGGYDYNSLSEQHQGDIRLSKQVRDLTRGTGFRDSITVRSGSLVQVSLELKNTSRYDTDITVTDEISGSSVFKRNSLTLAGTPLNGSITSGVSVHLAKKSDVTVYYEINVCSDAGYAARGYAYSAGIGSATDAAAIYTEQLQYGSSNYVSTCLSNFQQAYYSTGSNSNGTNSNPFGGWTGVNNADTGTYTNTNSNGTSSNPFGNWTGVNSNTSSSSSTNPFGGWTGVNSNSSTTSTNPFGGWSGVNSNTSSSSSNPFGGWTGVNNSNSGISSSNSANPFGEWSGVNSNTTTATSSNPFGDWSGVNNANSYSSNSVNPFGSWSGVNSNTSSSSSTNPFGGWTGVNNNDAGSYSGSNSNSSNSSNPFGDWGGVNSSGYSTAYASTDSGVGSMTNYSSDQTASTYRVAPTTGVDKFTPIWFALLLTAAFLAYRKRKWLFN
jgi:hypothetical protein